MTGQQQQGPGGTPQASRGGMSNPQQSRVCHKWAFIFLCVDTNNHISYNVFIRSASSVSNGRAVRGKKANISPVKLSCAGGTILAFSRCKNWALVVIRQDSMPGAGILTSWKHCYTGGYTRSPGLSARLSPPGSCHSYHTPWRWQGKAVTMLVWLLSLYAPALPTHTHTHTLYVLGVSPPSFVSAA